MRITLALASSLIGFAVSFADYGLAQTRLPYRARLQQICPPDFCDVRTAPIPFKRRIELENFSCLTRVNNGTLIEFAIDAVGAGPYFAHYPAGHWLRNAGTVQRIHYSEPTGLIATAGQRFRVYALSSGTSTSVDCFLYGDVVILP
jgi:hypothetical protein